MRVCQFHHSRKDYAPQSLNGFTRRVNRTDAAWDDREARKSLARVAYLAFPMIRKKAVLIASDARYIKLIKEIRNKKHGFS